MSTSKLSFDDISDFNKDHEASLADQTIKTGGGDFQRDLLPVKSHPVRFVGYVEMGLQPQRPYQGQDRPDAETIKIIFDVLSKDGQFKDDKGNIVGVRRVIQFMKLSQHQKAGFTKLFSKMREGDSTVTHMGDLLNRAYMLRVTWSQNGQLLATKAEREAAQAALKKDPENKELRIFENFRADGVMALSAPVRAVIDEDGMETGEVVNINIPAAYSSPEYFLQKSPNMDHWNSLFVEGEYENKDKDGVVTKVSKNRTQNEMIASASYEGSCLQAMLEGLPMPDETVVDGEEELEKDQTSQKKADEERAIAIDAEQAEIAAAEEAAATTAAKKVKAAATRKDKKASEEKKASATEETLDDDDDEEAAIAEMLAKMRAKKAAKKDAGKDDQSAIDELDLDKE